jgi:hypothetical protein
MELCNKIFFRRYVEFTSYFNILHQITDPYNRIKCTISLFDFKVKDVRVGILADILCKIYFCSAQIWFVINVPKQVMKPKGYIAALVMLILIIRSWTDRDLFEEWAHRIKVLHSFYWISILCKRCASILLAKLFT